MEVTRSLQWINEYDFLQKLRIYIGRGVKIQMKGNNFFISRRFLHGWGGDKKFKCKEELISLTRRFTRGGDNLFNLGDSRRRYSRGGGLEIQM